MVVTHKITLDNFVDVDGFPQRIMDTPNPWIPYAGEAAARYALFPTCPLRLIVGRRQNAGSHRFVNAFVYRNHCLSSMW